MPTFVGTQQTVDMELADLCLGSGYALLRALPEWGQPVELVIRMHIIDLGTTAIWSSICIFD
jgi:hypothetical protein